MVDSESCKTIDKPSEAKMTKGIVGGRGSGLSLGERPSLSLGPTERLGPVLN
jgi:hypothetical protein